MKLRPRPFAAALAALAAALLPTADADACGGCFHPANESQTTVVTGHRMAFAISTTQSVLWDQIQYAGSPADFAWVLPVKAGAVIETSNAAWFETLDAATSAQINAPPANNCASPSSGGCSGVGCGASAVSAAFDVPGVATTGPGVTVIHQGTVGPYETVTLHANVPNALPNWLTTNGYKIDPTVSPIIDAYSSEGFDFIALRLQPGEGIQQMTPVRVITPGATPSLPLRMVAAGTGANVAITLFVIGEGRWEVTAPFVNAQVDPSGLVWDFVTQSSNYATNRQNLLATNNGRTWNNAFANQGSLLSQDIVNGQPTFISVGGTQVSTVALAYLQQGITDQDGGQAVNFPCQNAFDVYASSMNQVVACSSGPGGGTGGSDAGAADGGALGSGPDVWGTGPPCTGLPADQIPASAFNCGAGLDDIAAALVGMHPESVWLTRLEANLPRAALGTDLALQASSQQQTVSNIFNPTKTIGDPCTFYPPVDAGAGSMRSARDVWTREQLALYGAIFASVAAALVRRRRAVPMGAPKRGPQNPSARAR